MKINLLSPPSLNELIACALVLIKKHPTSLHLDGLRRITTMSLDIDLFSSERVTKTIAKTVFATPLTTSLPPEDLYPIQQQAAKILGIHHDMPFMRAYKSSDGITLSDLDNLGWSKPMIKKYLGQPDIISPYGIYYSTYNRDRVEKASQIRTLKDALHLVQWQRKHRWSSRYNSPSKRQERLQKTDSKNDFDDGIQFSTPTDELVLSLLDIMDPHIPSINSTIIKIVPELFVAGYFAANVGLANSMGIMAFITTELQDDESLPCIFTVINLLKQEARNDRILQSLNDVILYAFMDPVVSHIYSEQPEYEKYEAAAYFNFEEKSVINELFEKIIIDHYCNPDSIYAKGKPAMV